MSEFDLTQSNECASYTEETRALRSGDPATRRALAQDGKTKPEVLFFLAEDPEASVRQAIADNPQTPVHARLVLARDGDTGVREAVARHVGGLTGELNTGGNAKHAAIALEVFQILAADQLPAIRAMVSDALAEVVGDAALGLKEIVKQLALDDVLEVAAPALERSALMTEDDLIELIESGIAEGGLSAIARRENLAAIVADAVVAKGDNQATAALLANRSAQIREETLDAILDEAPKVIEWHEPLVRRPKLSPKAARRIASFVASSLLEALRRREDLDPETANAVAEAVQARVRQDETGGWETPLDRAMRMYEAGELTEEEVDKAIAAGDRAFVTAALTARSGLAIEVVRDMIAARSGKAMVALSWKAGLTMRAAIKLQARIASIPPSGIVIASESGGFPLKVQDMEWQIEFFGG